MTLALDARRRAMLSEIGLRSFAVPPLALPAEPTAAAPPPARAAALPATEAAPRVHAAPLAPQPPESGVQPSGPVGLLSWEALQQAVAECRACGLCESRNSTVFGVGDTQPEWLVVGEAPGEQEDLQGEPFAGPAGQLLDNMLRSIGVERQRKVFVATALKCRPPGDRNPDPAEVEQCEPFLRRQVELLQPRIILAMGRFAVQSLLGSTEPIGRLRGRIHQYQGVPLVVTYPPAYLLRNLPEKARAWADLCLAMQQLRDQPGAASGNSGP